MKKGYIFSYDFGTSGVKIALVDLQGSLIDSEIVRYALLTPRPGWAEQDPNEFWAAVCRGTREVVTRQALTPQSVVGMAFGTQWKGIIPLNGQGRVLHNAIIWLDGRAKAQARELNARLGTDTFTERDYWARLMWVRQERPEIYDQTETFLEVNAFLKYKATGIKAVDLTNDFIHHPDPDIQRDYTRVLAAAELNTDKFPPMVMPTQKVGQLTAEAAAEMGLVEDIPVFGGCGDIPAIAIGAGCSTVGSAHIYLGSSGWLAVSVPGRKAGVGELYQAFDRGRELLLYVLQAACMAQNWAVKQFYRNEEERLAEGVFRFVDQDIAGVAPGCDRMIATPWLHGELPPLSNEARMVFFNIHNLHDRRHMMRAVLEGVCFSLRWKMEMYRAQTGHELDAIRVVGGGANSKPWMQSLADILGIPVVIPENAAHAGAIGTAYCAIVGLGICPDLDAADKMIRQDRMYSPDKGRRALYDELYGVYKDLYPSTRHLFETLNRSR